MAQTKKRNKRKINKHKVCPITDLARRCSGLQVEWKDPSPYESQTDKLYDFRYFHKNPIQSVSVKDFFSKNYEILMYGLELNWVVDLEAFFRDPDGNVTSNGYRHIESGTINDIRNSIEVISHNAIVDGGNFDDFTHIRIRLLSLGWGEYVWPDDYEYDEKLTDDVIHSELREMFNAIYSDENEAIQKNDDRLIRAS